MRERKTPLPDASAFRSIERYLVGLGFRRATDEEFRRDARRLKLARVTPGGPPEVGFVFTANGLTVAVWTSFIESAQEMRYTDAGWVLLKDGDRLRHTKQIYRTKNFVRNLKGYARVAQLRALRRPLCPNSACEARMRIARGVGFGAVYWRCDNQKKHKHYERRDWDECLPQEARDFLRPGRAKRRSYHKKLKAEGKKPGKGIRNRKTWKVGRPENLVPTSS